MEKIGFYRKNVGTFKSSDFYKKKIEQELDCN